MLPNPQGTLSNAHFSFEVGIALLTAVSSSADNGMTVHIRWNLLLCLTHTTLRVWRVHGLNSEFVKLCQ